MRTRLTPLLLALVTSAPIAVAACGGDDGGTGDDDVITPDANTAPDAAEPDAGAACAEVTTPTGTLAVPGTFSGTTVGGGADLNVAENVCDVQGADPTNPTWYDEPGEDVVVELTGLTAGTTYAVNLLSSDADDLGFYVITGCANGTPGAGQCPLFVDDTNAGEAYFFTAAGTSAYVVVDSFVADSADLTSGNFQLKVAEKQCDETTACGTDAPYCIGYTCGECQSSYECTTADAAVCDAFGSCGAGPSQCTGDDATDTDDGPAGAAVLVSGTPVTGHICDAPASEADYYQITVAAGEGLDLSLAWTDAAADLDIYVTDATGQTYGLSYWLNPEHVALTYLPAGTYYIQVDQYNGTAAAVEYTLTATKTADQTCATIADCAAVYSNQFYRGSCDVADGACKFIPAGDGAAGAACDSSDDCGTNGICSYIPFESDAQKSVCTIACATTADCSTLAGTTCVNAQFCIPSCTTDLECGAITSSGDLTTDQPWDYLTCTPATGECAI